MWHRFQPTLRNVVLHALRRAAQHGRPRAGAEDLLAAVADQSAQAQQSSQSDAPAANEFSADAMKAMESAYEEAATVGAKQIGLDHLRAALNLTTRPQSAAAASTPPAVTDELSAGHPRFAMDPYPLYARMRDVPPVRRDPVLPVWVVTGYEEAMSILRDTRFTVQRKSSRTSPDSFSIDVLPNGPVRKQLGALVSVLATKMIFLDPPEHTRVRNLMNQNFTPRACEQMRPRIQQIADELLDRAMRNGQIDLILDFALQLPIIVICEMIGLPAEDRVQLKKWADAVGNVIALGASLRQELDARRAMIDMRVYFDEVLERWRRAPGNNLLSMLLKNGYPSNEDEQAELFSNCVFLLGAGHETTTSLIGNGFRVLRNHPDQFELLARDPSIITTAVEELLRYESPVQWTSRQTRADVTVGAVEIKAGDSLLISLGAANRDPRQFPDPDRLDLKRKDAHRHLAFSGGVHFCLGAALSRVEAQVGLLTLLRRLPTVRIEQNDLKWKTGSTIRTLESLPAAF